MSWAAIIGGIVGLLSLTLVAAKYDYLVWDRGKISAPRLLKQAEIRSSDLPALVEALSRTTAPVRYAGLIFSTPDRPSDEDALNLQVSVENGKVGFDWNLLARRNIEDQRKFKAFALTHGVEPIARSENGVSYLRVEGVDSAKFAASVLTQIYHYPTNEPLWLVYEGFEWPAR